MLDHVGVQNEDGNQQVLEGALDRTDADDLMQCELIEADVVSAHEFVADCGEYY